MAELEDVLRDVIASNKALAQQLRDSWAAGGTQVSPSSVGASRANTSGASIAGGVSGAVGKVFSGLGTALSGLAAAITPVTIGLAAAAAGLALVEQFTRHVDPGASVLLDRSLKDLMATIGVGLTPVIKIFTSVIQEIGGILLPVMQGLAPVFGILSNTIGNLITAALKPLASIIETVTPVLAALAGIVESLGSLLGTVIQLVLLRFMILAEIIAVFAPALELLGDILKLFTDIVGTLIRVIGTVISAFFGALSDAVKETVGEFGTLREGFKQFADAIKQLVVGMTVFSLALMRFIGLGQVVDRVQKSLDKQTQKQQGAKSLENISPQISNMSQIGNAIATAAFAAMQNTAARQDSVESLLKEISENLKSLEGLSLEEMLVRVLSKFFDPKTAGSIIDQLTFGLTNLEGRDSNAARAAAHRDAALGALSPSGMVRSVGVNATRIGNQQMAR